MIPRAELQFTSHHISPDNLDHLIGLPYRRLEKHELLWLLSAAAKKALQEVSAGPYASQDAVIAAINSALMKMALFSDIGNYFRIDCFSYDCVERLEEGRLEVLIEAVSPQWVYESQGRESMLIPLGTVSLQFSPTR